MFFLMLKKGDKMREILEALKTQELIAVRNLLSGYRLSVSSIYSRQIQIQVLHNFQNHSVLI